MSAEKDCHLCGNKTQLRLVTIKPGAGSAENSQTSHGNASRPIGLTCTRKLYRWGGKNNPRRNQKEDVLMYLMLDLFSGLKGASSAMLEDQEWEVVTVDIVPEFEPTICKDIMELSVSELPHQEYDLVWASPPCNAFSPASEFAYWDKYNDVFLPKKPITLTFMSLVFKALAIINELNPPWWFLENPRGILHKFIGEPSGWVTYCQYGDVAMKPTNLWGRHPASFMYKHCYNGASCHESSPRGNKTHGTQGKKGAAIRAKVPYLLSKAVKESIENPGRSTLFDYLEVINRV